MLIHVFSAYCTFLGVHMTSVSDSLYHLIASTHSQKAAEVKLGTIFPRLQVSMTYKYARSCKLVTFHVFPPTMQATLYTQPQTPILVFEPGLCDCPPYPLQTQRLRRYSS